jgi:hypothetical protein
MINIQRPVCGTYKSDISIRTKCEKVTPPLHGMILVTTKAAAKLELFIFKVTKGPVC